MRGPKRKDNPIQEFLDSKWLDSQLGRSPKGIASVLGVPVADVTAVLRHRRDSLVKKAEKVPLAGTAWFSVDPYRMRAEFHTDEGITLMTELQLEVAIRESQDVTC